MIWNLCVSVISHFISFTFFMTLITWISLAIGALSTFLVRVDHPFPKTFSGFIRYCLPRELIRTKSCRTDVFFYFASRFGSSLTAPLMLGSTLCSTWVYGQLTEIFGEHKQEPEGWVVWFLVLILVTLAVDFITFYTHYLGHKFRTLWEFHKVHHSAKFLTPLTNRRFHPVQGIFDNFGTSLVLGSSLGLLSYIFSMPIFDYAIMGVDAYFWLNILSFYHLRHSHINMSYGWLEKWILSPAQHQLHHSQEVDHWDKNFGLCFSIWDRMFDTFLYSQPKESFRLGLPGEECDKYDTLFQLYFNPVVHVYRALCGKILDAKVVVESVDLESTIGLDVTDAIAQTDVEQI